MHRLWALFNFLESGSPSSSQAINASVQRAFEGEWTAQHESYARTVFAKVLRYCRHPRGTMDRGPAQLNELISKIKRSQYDPSIDVHENACGAKKVDPQRISLPDRAGILDPADHLTGQQLKEFLEMPVSTPTNCLVGKDFPACHKVDDKDWPHLFTQAAQPQNDHLSAARQSFDGGSQAHKKGVFFVSLIKLTPTDSSMIGAP